MRIDEEGHECLEQGDPVFLTQHGHTRPVQATFQGWVYRGPMLGFLTRFQLQDGVFVHMGTEVSTWTYAADS